jgi:transglutaminase-like putative cysteine protease
MTRIIRLPLVFLTAALLSCSNSHLIVDRSYRNDVEDDFRARAALYSASVPDLFRLPDTIKNNARREAVQFILAYMPLSDLAVYDPLFLLDNVNAALKAREETAWGASVPYEVFLHFVLPLRVNNENPDNFRISYYDELKKRIGGLSATAAALEINRWCQEKVAYQPSDSRTSAPMATILSARGRCGEESTFTVSALRAAGVPARQVYTPRWAHSDDNHAWVEFWSDGQWHYMGACEPEPVPDRGWFTEPARRAMLIHTRAFGRYNGTEPLVRNDKLYSEINVLDRYAPVKKLRVTVTDSTGVPVPGAEVGYLLYNYAEFYPLARLKCNAAGESIFTTGKGS